MKSFQFGLVIGCALGVTSLNMSLVNVANAHDGNGRFGLDITQYCVEKFGSGWRGDLNESLGAAGWSCFKEGSNGGRIGIDMTEACTMQYGSRYRAHNTDDTAAGWHCHKN